jgi:outer membrane protein TolC
MKISKVLIVFLFVLTSVAAYCDMLVLNDYLDIVLENNNDLKALQLNIDSINKKLAEIERVYSSFLIVGIDYLGNSSRSPYNSQITNPGNLTNLSYDMVISKQLLFGTQISLGINGSSHHYRYTFGAMNYDVNDVRPFIKLQQSLLKDINGVLTKTSIDERRSRAKSALYLLGYKKQNILLKAKLAYWNLSYAQTVVNFRKISLLRTEKLLDWNKKKYSMNLTDKSDLLQSQVAVKLGELDLELAYEEENKARRIFNQFLGIKQEKVKYNIEKLENKINYFESSKTLNKKMSRADVLAALEDCKVASYEEMFHKKDTGADLILSGQFAISGLEKTFSQAMKDMRNSNSSSYFVSLRYSLPLDFTLRRIANQGYESAKNAAYKSAEYLILDENNDWFQLVDNWNNAKLKLQFAFEIEKMQRQRHEENENMLRKGRSTTYFVLQSEQALDDAMLNVLKCILELIQIYEQAEIFYS